MNDPYIKFNWLLCNLLHRDALLIHFAGGWVICHQNRTLWKATFLLLQLFCFEMSFPGSCLLAGAELLQKSHRVSWKRRIWPVIFYIFISYRFITLSTVNISRICSHSPHPLEKALPCTTVNNIYCFLLFFLRARAASLSRGKKG